MAAADSRLHQAHYCVASRKSKNRPPTSGTAPTSACALAQRLAPTLALHTQWDAPESASASVSL